MNDNTDYNLINKNKKVKINKISLYTKYIYNFK